MVREFLELSAGASDLIIIHSLAHIIPEDDGIRVSIFFDWVVVIVSGYFGDGHGAAGVR